MYYYYFLIKWFYFGGLLLVIGSVNLAPKNFCTNSGQKYITERQFIIYFKKEFPNISYFKKRVDGKLYYGFHLKPSEKNSIIDKIRQYGYTKEELESTQEDMDPSIGTNDVHVIGAEKNKKSIDEYLFS